MQRSLGLHFHPLCITTLAAALYFLRVWLCATMCLPHGIWQRLASHTLNVQPDCIVSQTMKQLLCGIYTISSL